MKQNKTNVGLFRPPDLLISPESSLKYLLIFYFLIWLKLTAQQEASVGFDSRVRQSVLSMQFF